MATTNRATVLVDVTDYFRSNGRAPRGDGGWAFCTVDPRRADYLSHVFFVQGTYRAAKSQAVTTARARGVSLLFVLA